MKGQVYRTKRNARIHTVITLILGGVVWLYLNNLFTGHLKVDDPNMGVFNFTSIIIALMFTIVFWMVGISLFWSNINKRHKKFKADRYRLHYNRCIIALKNKDYNKVANIHDIYLRNQCEYTPLTARIRLAFRTAIGENLDDELLIPTTSPELDP